MLRFALTAILSFAVAHAAGTRAKPGPSPCSADFEFELIVSAGMPINSSDIGVRLTLKRGAVRGIASRIHTEQESEFGRADCERWQKRYWHVLDRVLFESKRSERLNMACLNVAAVKYRIGSKKETAQICLGDGRQDTVTYALRRFYEGTDDLIER